MQPGSPHPTLITHLGTYTDPNFKILQFRYIDHKIKGRDLGISVFQKFCNSVYKLQGYREHSFYTHTLITNIYKYIRTYIHTAVARVPATGWTVEEITAKMGRNTHAPPMFYQFQKRPQRPKT